MGVTADIRGSTDPNRFIVAAKLGFAVYDHSKPDALEYIAKVHDNSDDAEQLRFNDGAVDAKGRFWAGTISDFHVGEPENVGAIWKLDTDLKPVKVLSPITIPNGIAWSPDNKWMYLTDSMHPDRVMHKYPFDLEAGTLGDKPEDFFRLPEEIEGVIDGCAVDENGDVWAAVHDGEVVVQISGETGALKKVIRLKGAKKVTCPVFDGFGGMYVTTAGGGEDAESQVSGSLWKLNVGVKGLPKYEFAGKV